MKRTTLPEKFMDYDGIRIRYVDIGEGPTILFLHGLGGKIEDNDRCFPFLTDRFRVVAMDSPGTGWSDKPDRRYDMDYLVDFSLDFASRLRLERFYVVGGSQGGMHTLLCCLRAPERIPAVSIYSASGVWKPKPLLAALLRGMPPGFVHPLLWFTSHFWFSKDWPERDEARKASLDYINNAEMPGFGRHVLGCLASQFEKDYMKLYAEIETPTLILWGENDHGMPPSMGEKLHATLKNSEFHRVPNAGHNLSTEFPEMYAKRVGDFLSQYK
jgi:pimeloyl-ACP methyl ester carboxylesterase